MNIDSIDDGNPFTALAKALWKGGGDGAEIARQLAVAFTAIVEDEVENPVEEFRTIFEAEKQN